MRLHIRPDPSLRTPDTPVPVRIHQSPGMVDGVGGHGVPVGVGGVEGGKDGEDEVRGGVVGFEGESEGEEGREWKGVAGAPDLGV